MFFLAGVLGGTILANLLGGELKQQVGYFDTLFLAEQGLDLAGKQKLWLYVLRQRGMEFLGGWLLSVTVFSIPGFYLLSLLAGGSIAVVPVSYTHLDVYKRQPVTCGCKELVCQFFALAFLRFPCRFS